MSNRVLFAALGAALLATCAAAQTDLTSNELPVADAVAARPCTTWSADPVALRTPGFDLLNGVGAAGSGAWAVGLTVNPSGFPVAPLLEHWNGHSWRQAASPALAGKAGLRAVVAGPGGTAWAAGYQILPVGDVGLNRPLIERWDGRSWSLAAVPIPAPSPQAVELFGLWSPSETVVYAVGDGWDKYDVFFPFRPLLWRWDGTAWSLLAGPQGRDLGFAAFAVGGTSESDLWVVGSERHRTASAPRAAAHWDGSAWRIDPTNGPPLSQLWGVAALAPDDVWAVGQFLDSGNFHPLIEHWDGTVWSVASSPALDGMLSGVVARSARDVWAVGEVDTAQGTVPLLEHWDGRTWQVVHGADPGRRGGTLQAVTALPSGELLIVGSRGLPQGLTAPFVERSCP
jgi:hypothetical protein